MIRRGNKLCVHHLTGNCRYGSRCWYKHIDLPGNRPTPATTSASVPTPRVHILVSSTDKSCGICLDVVKTSFGLMPQCNHCFCFECLAKWRNTREFEYDVCKSCPECRTHADYIFNSNQWFDDLERKREYIEERKKKMKTIDCRYFKKGRGKCAFGNTCLYKHALSNGKKVDLGPPVRRRPNLGLDHHSEFIGTLVTWIRTELYDSGSDSSSFEPIDELNGETLSELYNFDLSMLDMYSDDDD